MPDDWRNRYRCKYEFAFRYGSPHHSWTVLGAFGAVHFHVLDCGKAKATPDRYSGGIEIHYRNLPPGRADIPPTHDQCWLLKAPCWHDGSSLQAEETWIPMWLHAPNNHVRMFAALAGFASRQFCPEERDDA